MTPLPIKISIVEDDRRLRESLAVLIDGTTEMRCVSTHRNAEEALQHIPAKKPDVVLMDINLPNISGIECVRKLKEILPKTQFLMLTMVEDGERIFEALTAGAGGYLLKRTPPSKLLEAIGEVHRGASPMSGQIARIVVEHFQKQKTQATPDGEELTRREQEILELLAEGYSGKELAQKLSISFDTVHTHLQNIYAKLRVHSRTEAVIKYFRK